jgi:ELWxxDGT repeat protein
MGLTPEEVAAMSSRTVGRPGLVLACAWLCLAAGAAAVGAQTAYLVADLAPGEGGVAGSNPGALFPVGKHVFFTATDGSRGFFPGELWATDGTAAGTRRLPPAEVVAFLTSVGDLLFFQDAERLWRSDGTPGGTFPLANAVTSSTGDLRDSQIFATLGGTLYWLAYGAVAGSTAPHQQLWRSDGTVAGTFMAADAGAGVISYGGSTPIVPQTAGGRLFFPAPEPAPNSTWSDLWVSDGTAAGTVPLTAFTQQLVTLALAAGDRLFFIAQHDPTAAAQLWVTDGTRGGTRLVRSAAISQLFPVGEKAYFVAAGVAGRHELWVSDGSAAGTLRLVANSKLVAGLASAGSQLVFLADDASQQSQLWVTDGSLSGTRQLTTGSGFPFPLGGDLAVLGHSFVYINEGLWSVDLAASTSQPPTDLCAGGGCGPPPQPPFYQLGGRVVFLNGSFDAGFDLWSSDGTFAGTSRIKQVCSGSCPDGTTGSLVGGAFFFLVPENEAFEIWRSDGTPAGTRRVAAPLLTEDFGVQAALIGQQVFLAASDVGNGSFAQGELWVTGGTAAGPRQLTDTTDPLSSSPASFAPLGDQVVFADSAGSPQGALWRSAGAAASTVPLPRAIASTDWVTLGGGVAFVDFANPPQLWWTDGTDTGTRQLTFFSPPLSGPSIAPLVVAGGLVYFVAEDNPGGGVPTTSDSLWTTDGTPQGTVKAAALPPAVGRVLRVAVFGSEVYMQSWTGDVWKVTLPAGASVQLTNLGQTFVDANPELTLVELGGVVFFLDPQQHLWQTDGTAAGTAMVQAADGTPLANAHDLVVAGGALYLFASSPNSRAPELWRTDGTPAGTAVLQQFVDSVLGPAGGITAFGGGIAFVADDGVHGPELWMSDGTPGGTRLVSDIRPGADGSNPTNLAVAAGRLYFAADDGMHGNELWVSDGTAAGTRMVQDINPGPASSNPSGMTAAGGLLYFAADDGLTGQEPWALPLGGAPTCGPPATALCLAGGRFRVEAFWRDFQGHSGAGQAQALSADTGTFWFFSPDDVEVIAKVLDGRALNGAFWVFYGALSNVEYYLTVTDTATGFVRRYYNPLGQLASVGDTAAFGPQGPDAIGGPPAAARTGGPAAAGASLPAAASEAPAPAVAGTPAAPGPRPARAAKAATPQANGGSCHPAPRRLCLNGGRFAVQATWTDFNGRSGTGSAVALTTETGYFWFFDSSNVETVLKVIDGRGLNGHFWVFYGALSNVQYTLTVTDTLTGAAKTYTNPAGQFASVADTSAF